MTNNQAEQIIKLLQDIKDLLSSQSNQSQTKITVVGNRATAGRPPKTAGLNTNDDFTL
jgi:hypothetical protein